MVGAAHDIGKVFPTVRAKLYRFFAGYLPNSMAEFKHVDTRSIEKTWRVHAGVGVATATVLDAGKFIPQILGQHYGDSPDLGGTVAADETFGGEAWE